MRNSKLSQLPAPQRQALLVWMNAHTPQKDDKQTTDSDSDSGSSLNALPEKTLDPPDTSNQIGLLNALITCFPVSSDSNPNPNPNTKDLNTLINWLTKSGIQLDDKSPKKNNENDASTDTDDIAFLCLLEILLNDLIEQSNSKSEKEKKLSFQLADLNEASMWKKIRFYILATLMGIFTSTEAFGSGLLIASVVTNKFAIQLLIATAITFIAIGLVCSIEIKSMAEEMDISYLEAKKIYKNILLKNELNKKISVHLEKLSKNQSPQLSLEFYTFLQTKLAGIEKRNQDTAIKQLEFLSNPQNKLRRQIIKNVISFLAASLNAAITYMTAISSIHSAASFALNAAALSSPLGIAITSIVVCAWILTYLFSWYCFERKVMTGSLSGLLSAEKDCKVELRAIAGEEYKKPKDPDPRTPASFFAKSLRDKTELGQIKSNQIQSN